MNYFDFYNKDTRHWSIKDVRDYFKDNNLKAGQESFKILRLILSKKKINKSDKKFLIDLGFFLEQESKESIIVQQIASDQELMSMTKDELAASWKEQRILIHYGDFPESYRWTDSYDDFIKLKNKFDKMMQLHVDEAYSIHLVEDCLTYGYSNHIPHRTKYHLNGKYKILTFVKDFRAVFLGHKIDEHIAGAILEAFDVGLTYNTCFAYLKRK